MAAVSAAVKEYGSTGKNGEDTKTAVVSPLKPLGTPSIALIKAAMRNAKGKRQILRTNLILSSVATSGAAAAQAPVIGIIPGSSSEFASFAAIYDEFICDGAVVHFRSALSAATNTSGITGAFAYDPVNNGTYGSVAGVLEAQKHFGPFAVAGAVSDTGVVGSPTATSNHGFWKHSFKFPKGASVKDPNTPSIIGTGVWTSTTVTTTAYGYWKGYVEPGSATITTSIIYWIVMHCRFRSRT